MSTMPSVATYGLVPIPGASAKLACGETEDRPPAPEQANAALLAWYRHDAAERLATHEELARLWQEVADLGAEPDPDHGATNPA
jgi:hypothetical protein